MPDPILVTARRRLTLRIIDAEAEQGDTSCQPGCTRCCQQLVPLAPVEVDALRDAVSRMPADQRRRLAERADRQYQHFDFLGLLDLLDDTPPGELGTIATQWASERIDCPFLEGDLCTVYDDRPLACRAQLVTSDPAECDRPHGRVVPLRLNGPGPVRELCGETGETFVAMATAMPAILGRSTDRAVR